MPLFTVVSFNRKDKVLVSGDTIDKVIATACKKLGLSSQQCKIVLDQNGALIDEDEFLSSLPILTEMMILTADEEWVSKEESVCRQGSILATRNKDNQQESNAKSGALVTNTTLVGERRAPLSFPWNKLSDTMTEKLERGETLSTMEARDLRKILGMHMIGTLRDYKRSTVSTLLKIFGNKYPQALKIVDADGELLNDGIEASIIRLYDHINYKKPSSEKRKKTRPSHSEDISENENNPRIHIDGRVYDEYGCVAYEVPLPEDETKDTQESKRLQLLHIKNSMSDCDKVENLVRATGDEIDRLMKSTYATQRKDIIDRKGGSKEVLLKWPYLEEANYFLAHASLLFGRDVKKVWEEKVSSKGLFLFSVLEIEQKKKNQVGQKRTEARICMREVIATANRASTNLRQETPKLLALFQLLPLYFLEDENEIFCLVTDTSSMEEMQFAGSTDRPILVVKGKSLYDENAVCQVFIEGESTLKPRTILEGFLCYFLSFYVFGYKYGDKSDKTLEFIQRVFQKINPVVGPKRGKKSKRTLHSVNPQVMKLIDRLADEADVL